MDQEEEAVEELSTTSFADEDDRRRRELYDIVIPALGDLNIFTMNEGEGQREVLSRISEHFQAAIRSDPRINELLSAMAGHEVDELQRMAPDEIQRRLALQLEASASVTMSGGGGSLSSRGSFGASEEGEGAASEEAEEEAAPSTEITLTGDGLPMRDDDAEVKLDDLMQPPTDILFLLGEEGAAPTLDQTMAYAAEHKKWIVLNVLSSDEGGLISISLNRDVWRKETVHDMIHTSFVFGQQESPLSATRRAQNKEKKKTRTQTEEQEMDYGSQVARWCQHNGLNPQDLPCIAFVNPYTGLCKKSMLRKARHMRDVTTNPAALRMLTQELEATMYELLESAMDIPVDEEIYLFAVPDKWTNGEDIDSWYHEGNRVAEAERAAAALGIDEDGDLAGGAGFSDEEESERYSGSEADGEDADAGFSDDDEDGEAEFSSSDEDDGDEEGSSDDDGMPGLIGSSSGTESEENPRTAPAPPLSDGKSLLQHAMGGSTAAAAAAAPVPNSSWSERIQVSAAASRLIEARAAMTCAETALSDAPLSADARTRVGLQRARERTCTDVLELLRATAPDAIRTGRAAHTRTMTTLKRSESRIELAKIFQTHPDAEQSVDELWELSIADSLGVNTLLRSTKRTEGLPRIAQKALINSHKFLATAYSELNLVLCTKLHVDAWVDDQCTKDHQVNVMAFNKTWAPLMAKHSLQSSRWTAPYGLKKLVQEMEVCLKPGTNNRPTIEAMLELRHIDISRYSTYEEQLNILVKSLHLSTDSALLDIARKYTGDTSGPVAELVKIFCHVGLSDIARLRWLAQYFDEGKVGKRQLEELVKKLVVDRCVKKKQHGVLLKVEDFVAMLYHFADLSDDEFYGPGDAGIYKMVRYPPPDGFAEICAVARGEGPARVAAPAPRAATGASAEAEADSYDSDASESYDDDEMPGLVDSSSDEGGSSDDMPALAQSESDGDSDESMPDLVASSDSGEESEDSGDQRERRQEDLDVLIVDLTKTKDSGNAKFKANQFSGASAQYASVLAKIESLRDDEDGKYIDPRIVQLRVTCNLNQAQSQLKLKKAKNFEKAYKCAAKAHLLLTGMHGAHMNASRRWGWQQKASLRMAHACVKWTRKQSGYCLPLLAKAHFDAFLDSIAQSSGTRSGSTRSLPYAKFEENWSVVREALDEMSQELNRSNDRDRAITLEKALDQQSGFFVKAVGTHESFLRSMCELRFGSAPEYVGSQSQQVRADLIASFCESTTNRAQYWFTHFVAEDERLAHGQVQRSIELLGRYGFGDTHRLLILISKRELRLSVVEMFLDEQIHILDVASEGVGRVTALQKSKAVEQFCTFFENPDVFEKIKIVSSRPSEGTFTRFWQTPPTSLGPRPSRHDDVDLREKRRVILEHDIVPKKRKKKRGKKKKKKASPKASEKFEPTASEGSGTTRALIEKRRQERAIAKANANAKQAAMDAAQRERATRHPTVRTPAQPSFVPAPASPKEPVAPYVPKKLFRCSAAGTCEEPTGKGRWLFDVDTRVMVSCDEGCHTTFHECCFDTRLKNEGIATAKRIGGLPCWTPDCAGFIDKCTYVSHRSKPGGYLANPLNSDEIWNPIRGGWGSKAKLLDGGGNTTWFRSKSIKLHVDKTARLEREAERAAAAAASSSAKAGESRSETGSTKRASASEEQRAAKKKLSDEAKQRRKAKQVELAKSIRAAPTLERAAQLLSTKGAAFGLSKKGLKKLHALMEVCLFTDILDSMAKISANRAATGNLEQRIKSMTRVKEVAVAGPPVIVAPVKTKRSTASASVSPSAPTAPTEPAAAATPVVPLAPSTTEWYPAATTTYPLRNASGKGWDGKTYVEGRTGRTSSDESRFSSTAEPFIFRGAPEQGASHNRVPSTTDIPWSADPHYVSDTASAFEALQPQPTAPRTILKRGEGPTSAGVPAPRPVLPEEATPAVEAEDAAKEAATIETKEREAQLVIIYRTCIAEMGFRDGGFPNLVVKRGRSSGKRYHDEFKKWVQTCTIDKFTTVDDIYAKFNEDKSMWRKRAQEIEELLRKRNAQAASRTRDLRQQKTPSWGNPTGGQSQAAAAQRPDVFQGATEISFSEGQGFSLDDIAIEPAPVEWGKPRMSTGAAPVAAPVFDVVSDNEAISDDSESEEEEDVGGAASSPSASSEVAAKQSKLVSDAKVFVKEFQEEVASGAFAEQMKLVKGATHSRANKRTNKRKRKKLAKVKKQLLVVALCKMNPGPCVFRWTGVAGRDTGMGGGEDIEELELKLNENIAEPSASVSQDNDCVVCFDAFTNPIITLCCTRLVCFHCIKQSIAAKTRQLTDAGKTEVMGCPLCRAESELDGVTNVMKWDMCVEKEQVEEFENLLNEDSTDEIAARKKQAAEQQVARDARLEAQKQRRASRRAKNEQIARRNAVRAVQREKVHMVELYNYIVKFGDTSGWAQLFEHRAADPSVQSSRGIFIVGTPKRATLAVLENAKTDIIDAQVTAKNGSPAATTTPTAADEGREDEDEDVDELINLFLPGEEW